MNLWHDIEPGNKDAINVVIEIPSGSKNKYEIDKETGLISLDRAMHTTQDYPVDYGFVPRTYYYDDDPLDVVVLTTYSLFPGVMVKVRPVALINMIDGGDRDDKVIGVPLEDPRWDNVKDKKDINEHTIRELKHFFETYKGLQNKVVEITGVSSAEDARKAFQESIEMYSNKFK